MAAENLLLKDFSQVMKSGLFSFWGSHLSQFQNSNMFLTWVQEVVTKKPAWAKQKTGKNFLNTMMLALSQRMNSAASQDFATTLGTH